MTELKRIIVIAELDDGSGLIADTARQPEPWEPLGVTISQEPVEKQRKDRYEWPEVIGHRATFELKGFNGFTSTPDLWRDLPEGWTIT